MTDKPAIVQWVEDNYQGIECSFYETLGTAAYGAAFASAFTPAFWTALGLGAIGAAAELAWSLSGCDGDPPPPPEGGTCFDYGECVRIEQNVPGAQVETWLPVGSALSINSWRYVKGDLPIGESPVQISWTDCNGNQMLSQGQDGYKMRLVPNETSVCGRPGLPAPEPGPIGPPQVHETEDGCEWTITPTDAYVDDKGSWHTYYVISSSNDDVCGGPFAYWSSREGPDWVEPRPPDQPTPDPGKDNMDCCEEVLSKLDALLAGQREILDKLPEDEFPWAELLLLLGALLDLLTSQPPQYEADTYILKGICEELNDEGEQPEFSTPVLGGTFDVAVLSRLDSMQHLLQAHLGYKTPTCTEPKPELEGDWRTISFISDEVSPEGKSRLRKRFRYRSSSGLGLSDVVDHWKSFTFTAGAVCVQHKGAPWGTPQVWASTIDEGKRVIRHAGGEAGIDPDQVGEWRISGSDNPRYGLPGTMRVNTSGGYYWITERLDSNNRPMVETVSPDP